MIPIGSPQMYQFKMSTMYIFYSRSLVDIIFIDYFLDTLLSTLILFSEWILRSVIWHYKEEDSIRKTL